MTKRTERLIARGLLGILVVSLVVRSLGIVLLIVFGLTVINVLRGR